MLILHPHPHTKYHSTYQFVLFFLLLALSLLSGCNRLPEIVPAPPATPTVIYLPLEVPLPNPPLPTVEEPPVTMLNDATPDKLPFSIIWLADTQTIAYHEHNDVFEAMGKWIREQRTPYNVKYIVQTGDLVDNGYVQKQWDSFDIMSSQFFGTIPYLPIAGNHDLGVKLERYAAYLERPYVKAIPPERSFKRGQAVYAEFRAGDQDFLIVGAGWNADHTSVGWINQVLRTHPNHVAILMFHSYVNGKDKLSKQGRYLREMVVAKNPNVRLVLSGHLRGSGYILDEFDDDGDGVTDRHVHAMLYNFQGYAYENSGQIRMLTFDPETRSIHVFTYSPFSGHYYRDDHFQKEEFELEDAF